MWLLHIHTVRGSPNPRTDFNKLKVMKYIKRTFLSVCCLLTVNIMAAQFSVYASTGLSGLKYRVEGGTQSAGIGYGGGAGYSFKIRSVGTSAWKAGVAVEVATYGNRATFGTLSERYEQGTGKDRVRFSYSLSGYEEKQNVTALSIPVTLQYQTGSRICFRIAGGVKFGLPVSARANINPGTATASGEYSHENQTYVNLPQHGFPDGIKLAKTKDDIDLGYSTALTVETGLLVKKFYAGLYLDYGLNSMQKTTDRHPLEYKESEFSMFEHNSILNTGLVNKINLFSTGLKIGILF